ncbi:MAG: response regulator [Planctomycetes bacterium]|nr:response regulator [Planctomycetota bacterium]
MKQPQPPDEPQAEDLVRANRILSRRAERYRVDLERLEDMKERQNAILRSVINEMRATQLRLEAKNHELEELTQELRGTNAQLRMTQSRLLASEQAAQEASTAKSRFLAHMSHELRTPLNGIIGMTELLLRTLEQEADRELAQIVGASGQALLAIINDIPDFSKLEAGKLEIDAVEFELLPCLESVIDLHVTRAEQRGLDLILDADPRLPTRVRGDPARLRQVLINLTSNAIKFTPQGEIVLRARVLPGESLEFSVRDTGIGIPHDKLSQLFLPFTQLDASHARTHGGTGLGLAISLQLAEAMGGELSVNSPSGEGATFRFTVDFPVIVGPKVRASPLELKVLVLEQAATSRGVLCDLLVDLGCRAIPAATLADALRLLGEERVDAAIVDHRIRSQEGAGLAGELIAAAGPVAPRTFLLVPTVHLNRVHSLREEGYSSVIGRPFKRSSLERALSWSTRSQRPALPDPPPLDPQVQILVVEDNPINRKVTRHLLERAGYACHVAEDGPEALTAFRDTRFDLVLMDVQMPGMDGYQVTRGLREVERARGDARPVPVVAVTAGVSEDERARCREAGMVEFLEKPLRWQVLSDAVARVLDLNRASSQAGGR